MKGCHNCEYAARIAAHEFENTPWEETPCAKCRLEEDRHDVREYVEDRGESLRSGDGVTPRDEDCVAEELMPASVLADGLRMFLALPRDALDVLVLRYQGLPYKEIGRMLGTSAAGAEIRHKRLLQQVPALPPLYPRKAGKAERRGRKGKRGDPA
jgi:DNA-directed RNA polymerase specialized sigma24 family protein